MAKEKKPLTPEQAEIKAMKKKKNGERTTKFFAVLLAAILTLAVVFSGRSVAKKNVESAAGNNTQQGDNSSSDSDDDVVFGFDDPADTTSGDDAQTPSGGDNAQTPSGGDDAQTPSGGGQSGGAAQSTSVSKADAVKALNDATKKAANAGYDWSRSAKYSKPLSVSAVGADATSVLNGIISGVDKNASIDSVVGNFLDITGNDAKTATKAKGAGMPEEMKKDKFLLKGMTLTEGDIKQYQVKGNTYKFQLNPCANPQKDGSNALHRATNDFITQSEVSDGIKDALGSAANLLTVKSANVSYKSIVITAVIENGQLNSLELSYVMDVASLELRATLIPITGTGAGTIQETYSNFKY